MCARYTMTKVAVDELAAELGIDLATAPAIEPSFNIAPTESSPIVLEDKEGARLLKNARFGLVPHWAKDLKIGARMLNARSETVAEKPAFRDALVKHRCLVLADGFYEWRREGKLRIPLYFHLPGGELFAFAGLWAAWKSPSGEWVTSFAILTREAEGEVRAIHDREPVVLSRDVYTYWLDREIKEPAIVKRLLDQNLCHALVGHQVSRKVNYVDNDGPELIEPDAS